MLFKYNPRLRETMGESVKFLSLQSYHGFKMIRRAGRTTATSKLTRQTIDEIKD